MGQRELSENRNEKTNQIRPKVYVAFVLVALALLRIILSYMAGNAFWSTQFYDDALMIRYADLSSHFLDQNAWSLVKTMSYPLFLNAVKASQINYSVVLAGLWIIASLSAFDMIYKICKNRIISILAFAYFLFLPMGFELWVGTRLYRNAMIAPFVIILFCGQIKTIYMLKTKGYLNVWALIGKMVFGLAFSFTFYIKEDGIWLLACLLFSNLVELIIILHFFRKKAIRIKQLILSIVAVILPVCIFACCTEMYKSINERFFGVHEIQTRTAGEYGEFVSLVYKIKSDNRTSTVWAPADAIEKAFDASKTLSKYPELEEDVLHSDWCSNDIYKNPIKGDLLTWVLRYSLDKCGIWESESQINALFKTVNAELEEAFENHDLEEDDRIQLLSSAGGRNIEEILSLRHLAGENLKSAICLEGYRPGAKQGNSSEEELSALAGDYTNIDYLTDYTKRDTGTMRIANKIISVIFTVYRGINITMLVLVIVMFVLFFGRCIKAIKNRTYFINKHPRELFLILTVLVLSGISIVYSFSIAWFSEFLFIDKMDFEIVNFYNVALPPLLGLIYLFSLSYVYAFGCNVLKKFQKQSHKFV